MTRRIDEHHGAIIDDHLVSADVLRDTARFAAATSASRMASSKLVLP